MLYCRSSTSYIPVIETRVSFSNYPSSETQLASKRIYSTLNSGDPKRRKIGEPTIPVESLRSAIRSAGLSDKVIGEGGTVNISLSMLEKSSRCLNF